MRKTKCPYNCSDGIIFGEYRDADINCPFCKSQKIVYLCGAINGCSDEECKDWRSLIKSKFNCLDPMVRDYRGKEESNYKEIVELDKKDIDDSSILLVNYIKPSVGTSMEILYAFERNKLIFIVVPKGIPISPWLRYHSHNIFESFEGAILEIQKCINN